MDTFNIYDTPFGATQKQRRSLKACSERGIILYEDESSNVKLKFNGAPARPSRSLLCVHDKSPLHNMPKDDPAIVTQAYCNAGSKTPVLSMRCETKSGRAFRLLIVNPSVAGAEDMSSLIGLTVDKVRITLSVNQQASRTEENQAGVRTRITYQQPVTICEQINLARNESNMTSVTRRANRKTRDKHTRKKFIIWSPTTLGRRPFQKNNVARASSVLETRPFIMVSDMLADA